MSIKKHTKLFETNSDVVYLDCNATTPIEPEVQNEVVRFLSQEFGNAGSRTHEFGTRAKQAVQMARDGVAAVVGAERQDVIFTSGATESNNIAILGLAAYGQESGRRHIISTQIEHKAVLEPLAEMKARGFEIELLSPNRGGWIDPGAVLAALRSDTLLVSVMHANNETGIIQPVEEIGESLGQHDAYFHVDAAQTFGKVISPLQHPRIDLISASGHKIYGPKGVGALITRARGYTRPPLRPVIFGGGQERGLRPGTLPVPLIVGLGVAANIALKSHVQRAEKCRVFREGLERAFERFRPRIHGDQRRALPHVINLSFPAVDSEAVMVALKREIAMSNGSACTSASYEPSHVLRAMNVPQDEIMGALRFSWCHMTPAVNWNNITQLLGSLM